MPFENAGENLAPVSFVARSDDRTLARPPPIQIVLDIFFAQGKTRGTTIDHNANTAAMRFAPGRDAKEVAEGVAHVAES